MASGYHVGQGSYMLFKNDKVLSRRDQVMSFVKTFVRSSTHILI